MEKEIIQQAYEQELMGRFQMMVQTDIADGLATAQKRFSDGLTQLRKVRDAALAIVGE